MRNYIDEHLKIDEASIQIERAHRIRGKKSQRPIIVKFAECARLEKFEGDHSILIFCRKYDIVKLNETR